MDSTLKITGTGAEVMDLLVNDLKKLEKEKTITEDEQKKAEAEVQKLTDKFVADADKRSQAKEKEIMDI